MANVKDDEFETLEFADESEYIDDGEEPTLVDEIANLIADGFGRSVIDANRELATECMAKEPPSPGVIRWLGGSFAFGRRAPIGGERTPGVRQRVYLTGATPSSTGAIGHQRCRRPTLRHTARSR